MSLETFLNSLDRAGIHVQPEDVLDILWLAQLSRKLELHDEASPALEPGGPAIDPDAHQRPPVIAGKRPPTEVKTDPGPKDESLLPSEPSNQPLTEVYSAGEWGESKDSIRASPVVVPAGHALPGRLAFARAMRPFQQRWESRREMDLDEELTVEMTAELNGELYPVFRPRAERWFDVDVVLEDDQIVLVWQDVMRDFSQMLRDTGAFRDVRRWRLRMGERPSLEAGGVRLPALSLAGGGSRRLIFFVTHGSSIHWENGGYARLLARWTRSCAVAILQMQPQHRWKRTALGEPSGVCAALEPGIVSAHLQVETNWWSMAESSGAEALVQVPILPLDAAAVRDFALMQMARGKRCAVVALDPAAAPAEPGPPARKKRDIPRVLALLAEKSKPAYQLAVYLSAGAFTLPVARLVQEAMFGAAADQAHLADVLLSGLLTSRAADSEHDDANLVYYEFHPEARNLLLRSLREVDARQVAESLESRVSNYIEKIYGRTITFQALVPDENGNYKLPTWAQPFARLSLSLLGLPASGVSVRQLVQGFESANSLRVVGRVARFAVSNAGTPFRRDLLGDEISRALERGRLARQNSDGALQFLPGIAPLLAAMVASRPLLGARILWVDDHPANNETETKLFEGLGASIKAAATTAEALASAGAEPFDVIITDMVRENNPRAGIAILEPLRRLQSEPPVIIYAGRFDETLKTDALNAGAFGCTNNAGELQRLVIEALRIKDTSDRTQNARDRRLRAALRAIGLAEASALQTAARIAEAILLATRDRHEGLVHCLQVVQAYADSGVNQLFVIREGELVILADVIDPGKHRYPVADWSGVIGRAATTGNTVWVGRVKDDANYIAAEATTLSELAVPLKVDGETLGVVNIEMARPDSLGDDDIKWLQEFYEMIAVVIWAARKTRILLDFGDVNFAGRIVRSLRIRLGIEVETIRISESFPVSVVLCPISVREAARWSAVESARGGAWLIPLVIDSEDPQVWLSGYRTIFFNKDFEAGMAQLEEVLLSGGALAGTASPRAATVAVQQSSSNGNVVRIYYGTDRTPVGESDYGSDRGTLGYGYSDVSIPPTHTIGQIEEPSMLRLQFREDREKHMVIVSSRRTSGLSLPDTLTQEITIFVHGWNVDFSRAVLRMAQIAYDLQRDATYVLYSWPSAARVAAYMRDLNTVQGTAAGFAEFLARVLAQARGRTVHVWGHDMGCRVVLSALTNLERNVPSPILANLVLTFADADEDWFRSTLGRVRSNAHRVTVYTATESLALKAAQEVSRAPRAGISARPIEGADVVVDRYNTTGWSRELLVDINYLFRGLPPEERFGLKRIESGGGTIWEMPPPASRGPINLS